MIERRRFQIDIIYGTELRYKQLCEIFNETPTFASNQKTQLRKWGQEYEIQYKDKKYVIVKKYTEMEQEYNKLKGVYLKLFEMVLSDILSKEDGYMASYSMMELLQTMRIVNLDYKYCRYNINDTSIILDTDPDQLELYMTKTHVMLSSLVKRILDNLADKSLIEVRQGYRLYKDFGTYTNIKEVPLGSQLESEILSIQNTTLLDFGDSKLSDVYKNENKIRQFKKHTQIKCKELLGWNGFFKVYYITLNKTGLISNVNKLYQELNKKIKTKLSNSSVLNNIEDLDMLIEATIDLKRPYKIKESLNLSVD